MPPGQRRAFAFIPVDLRLLVPASVLLAGHLLVLGVNERLVGVGHQGPLPQPAFHGVLHPRKAHRAGIIRLRISRTSEGQLTQKSNAQQQRGGSPERETYSRSEERRVGKECRYGT